MGRLQTKGENMKKNLEKLKDRYGKKFTRDKAINRDLDEELKGLSS